MAPPRHRKIDCEVHVLQEFNRFAECCKCLKLKNGSGSEWALEESGLYWYRVSSRVHNVIVVRVC